MADIQLPRWLVWAGIAFGILAGAMNLALFIQNAKSVHIIVVGAAIVGTGIFAWANLGRGQSRPEDD